MAVLLSTAYFPPVSYFAAMAQEMAGLVDRRGDDSSLELTPSLVYIEACENYQKQSYRNRCRFYAADGVQTLSFPIVHEEGKILISEVKVDYKRPWVQQHERAIVSAYGMSAYFDYYKDELFSILEAHHEKLMDLNMAIMNFFIDKIGLCVDVRLTQEFRKEVPWSDLRDIIHPKRPDTILRDLSLEKPYFQVFSPKYGFQSDLSIMDLLFNEGPDSIVYLKRV